MHPLAQKMSETDETVKKFINEQSSSAVNEESVARTEKEGIRTNLSVKHPFIKDKFLPIYIANFILMDYGTGAI